MEMSLPPPPHDNDLDVKKNNQLRSQQRQHPNLRSGHSVAQKATNKQQKLTLTKDNGKIAFQLTSRPILGMKEISLVDGFIKLYDSTTSGYSTRRDVLMPTVGVLIHSLGQLSLVSNAQPNRTMFAIRGNHTNEARRRLLDDKIESYLETNNVHGVRDLILNDYIPFISAAGDVESENVMYLQTPDVPSQHERRRLSEEQTEKASTAQSTSTNTTMTTNNTSATDVSKGETDDAKQPSRQVFPFPFIPDDPQLSMRRDRPPAKLPTREQQLEANAGTCEFEIQMMVQEEKWEMKKWRKLVYRYLRDITNYDPAVRKKLLEEAKERREKKIKDSGNIRRNRQTGKQQHQQTMGHMDEALLMTMNGTIHSPNCNFEASVNVTAIRTDWKKTSGKALNYSFYMMLACMTQIIVILRQLLHSQSQSAATRVSLLCIGWQTVIDALHFIVNAYWSLAMNPLFTAFASIAFFKLLIFSILEVKYMAIIVQARNANRGITSERLRQQIAMIQLRFYVALIFVILLSFYVTGIYKVLSLLLLYSFWVPQILQNIVTEAKQPLHPYYIFGMSITRLISPTYLLAVPNNFLTELYPDSPHSVLTVELLALWIAIQTAVLVGQSKYGTRFMIPARFLPPKFDYNRPIPASLLPPGALEDTPSDELQNERGPRPTTHSSSLSGIAQSPGRRGDAASATSTAHSVSESTGTTRNRIKNRRSNRTEQQQGMVEEVVPSSSGSVQPMMECVICCTDIDIRDRPGYMLAPCDHIFHKDCLVKWMDIKMECPVCRTKLPAL